MSSRRSKAHKPVKQDQPAWSWSSRGKPAVASAGAAAYVAQCRRREIEKMHRKPFVMESDAPPVRVPAPAPMLLLGAGPIRLLLPANVPCAVQRPTALELLAPAVAALPSKAA